MRANGANHDAPFTAVPRTLQPTTKVSNATASILMCHLPALSLRERPVRAPFAVLSTPTADTRAINDPRFCKLLDPSGSIAVPSWPQERSPLATLTGKKAARLRLHHKLSCIETATGQTKLARTPRESTPGRVIVAGYVPLA